MAMHLNIALLFAVTLFLAFAEDYVKMFYKVLILAAYALFMIFLASTKSIQHTADASSYETIFYNNDDELVTLTTEPTYLYLSRMVLALGGNVSVVFFIYALISIPAKLKAMLQMTPYVFTALLIYIPVYYELHDMVQIRVAAAAAFLLFSLLRIADKRYWQAGLLWVCAILFHYSALAFLPVLLIGNRKFGPKWRIALAITVIAFFGLYILGKDIFFLIPSGMIYGKIDAYQQTSEKGLWEMALLYKNAYYMAKFAFLFLCLYYYDFLIKANKLAPILITVFTASVLTPMLVSSVPIIASRIGDLYGIVDPVVCTFLLSLVAPKYLARTGIALIGLYMMVYNMIVSEYFF